MEKKENFKITKFNEFNIIAKFVRLEKNYVKKLEN